MSEPTDTAFISGCQAGTEDACIDHHIDRLYIMPWDIPGWLSFGEAMNNIYQRFISDHPGKYGLTTGECPETRYVRLAIVPRINARIGKKQIPEDLLPLPDYLTHISMCFAERTTQTEFSDPKCPTRVEFFLQHFVSR